MYVCMVITCSRLGISPYGYQSCSWSAGQGKCIFPCPRLRLKIWSRETGSAVPYRVSMLLISVLRLNLVLTYGIPPDSRGGVHLFIPKGRSDPCLPRPAHSRTLVVKLSSLFFCPWDRSYMAYADHKQDWQPYPV